MMFGLGPKEMSEIVGDFWEKWYRANDVDRIKMVQTLTGLNDCAIAILVNSYLSDLADTIGTWD